MFQEEMFDVPKDKDYLGEEGYTCIKCNVRKHKKNFHTMPSGEVKRTCYKCKTKSKTLVNRLRRQYPEPDKNYQCPLCKRTLEDLKKSGQKKMSSWVLDHDHITGEFRGYLCHHCNTGLGNFKDDLSILNRAKKYLEQC